MSSSSAGQWMPRPPPISRQEFRSSAVPCSRRGYQASGAAIERPSASSTDSVSALTSTPIANASRISTVEELIPALQQLLPMLLDQRPDLVQFLPAEAVAPLQANGVKPELRLRVVTLDMDVSGFTAVPCVEEKTERPHSEYSRHLPSYHARPQNHASAVSSTAAFYTVTWTGSETARRSLYSYTASTMYVPGGTGSTGIVANRWTFAVNFSPGSRCNSDGSRV